MIEEEELWLTEAVVVRTAATISLQGRDKANNVQVSRWVEIQIGHGRVHCGK
jgi:hypothetical protein